MSQQSLREQEGFIPVEEGYRVWYRIFGGGAEHERIPLFFFFKQKTAYEIQETGMELVELLLHGTVEQLHVRIWKCRERCSNGDQSRIRVCRP